MRAWLALTAIGCGMGASACNLVFGLEPPTGGGPVDAATSVDADDGTDAAPPVYGAVHAVSASYVQNGVTYRARSVAISVGDSATTCTPIASTAECGSWTCVHGTEPMTRPHAGTVMVGGLISTFTLTPDSAGFYTPAADSVAELYGDGGTATVVASGGDVPAFQLSVPAPSRAHFDQSWLPAPGEPPALLTRNTFALTWAPLAADDATVVVGIGQTTPDGTPYWTSNCTYPADRGYGSYDAAILANAPAGALSLSALVVNRVSTTLDGYVMNTVVSVIVVRPDGARVFGAVTVN